MKYFKKEVLIIEKATQEALGTKMLQKSSTYWWNE